MPRLRLLALCTTLLAACSGDTVAPTSVATPQAGAVASTSPTFLTQDPNAPAVANPVVSFWAKKGVDRSISMYYQPAPGARDSALAMFFRVRAKSLWLRPDGTTIANGDSIYITATLVDPVTMEIDFQPSGLRFSPKDPAKLKLSFLHADDDLNGDGAVNGSDVSLEKSLLVWRRESPLSPWQSLLSKVSLGSHEVEADIGGFTGYVIAW